MAGQTSYYHYDGLGSTQLLKDGDGNVTEDINLYRPMMRELAKAKAQEARSSGRSR